METVTTVLNWVAINVPWEEIFASGVLTGVITVALVPVYRLVQKVYTHYKEVMIVAVGMLSLTVSYLVTYFSNNPEALGFSTVRGLAIAFATQPFYKIILKPLYGVIAQGFANQVASAKAAQERDAALVPEGGIPTPEHATFSN